MSTNLLISIVIHRIVISFDDLIFVHRCWYNRWTDLGTWALWACAIETKVMANSGERTQELLINHWATKEDKRVIIILITQKHPERKCEIYRNKNISNSANFHLLRSFLKKLVFAFNNCITMLFASPNEKSYELKFSALRLSFRFSGSPCAFGAASCVNTFSEFSRNSIKCIFHGPYNASGIRTPFFFPTAKINCWQQWRNTQIRQERRAYAFDREI